MPRHSAQDETIMEFRDVTFAFSNEPPLLKELSLAIQKGAFYLIRGPSGAGKSTLLRLLNRLEEPVSGEIRFRQKPLASYPPPRLRSLVLYIQQSPTVVDGSVEENLLLPFSLKIHQHRVKPEREKIEELLKTVHLGEVALTDPAGTLSVGQMQRLCLIRGLLLEPDVLLLDEPTSSLDGDSASAVTALVERLNLESHVTVLSATHHAHGGGHVPYRYLEIRDGRVEALS